MESEFPMQKEIYDMMMKMNLMFLFILVLSVECSGKVWNIGPGRTYQKPSQLVSLVGNGDTIYLDPAIYENDAVKWTKPNLRIIGLGSTTSRPVLKFTGNIPNGKGIFVFENPGTCDNAYIENIIFDGAQVSDANGANGAGIRFQAVNLTVNKCKFMNCQNGILEGHGAVTTSNVTIINSEFENNGYQERNNANYSGYEHHIYISSSADSLLVSNCWFHHPRGQANSIKTRAQRSFILYNKIDEADTGYGSWEINIAQGGLNIIMGNLIIQGNAGANHGIISYDAATNAIQDFYFVHNTVINRYKGNIRYFNISPSSGINQFKIYNNIFASLPGASNTFLSGNQPGSLDSLANLFSSDFYQLGFKNPAADDYRLSSASGALIDKARDAGLASSGFLLKPDQEFVHHDSILRNRILQGTTLDIGAFENQSLVSFTGSELFNDFKIAPNPAQNSFTLAGLHSTEMRLELWNDQGIRLKQFGLNDVVDVSDIPTGNYYIRSASASTVFVMKLLVIH